MNVIGNTVIQLATGRYVDPCDLQIEDVRISDIAAALSKQCRFSGHVREFYSVAEHSVRVSWYIAATGGDHEEQMLGLMHDAPEYVLQDMPRPLKHRSGFGETYREYEEKTWHVIADAFGLQHELSSLVKLADNVMLVTERRDLMPNDGVVWEGFEQYHPHWQVIEPWTPLRAENAFLTRYYVLREELL